MKKILSFTLALLIVFSLASCGGSAVTCDAHKDYDGDGYYCDICGAIYICPDHVDEDEDGACDTCAAAYECDGHADANKDGVCDKCKAPFTCPGHKDVNGVGKCDICNAKFICDHVDADGNLKCDKCLAAFTCANHKDANADGFCDFCLGALECGPDSHRDVDGNSLCDICGTAYACSGYIDADGDSECDECGAIKTLHGKPGKADSIAAFMYAYANSAPTKVVSETVRTIGRGTSSYTLVTNSSLFAGTIAGKAAAVYEQSGQELNDIESGAGETEESVFKSVNYKKEFLQDKGVRETKDGKSGNWSARGTNFAPTKGSIALRITEETVKDLKFTITDTKHVMEFKVTKANVASVFGVSAEGNDMTDTNASDVSVVITSNGTTIESVVISYTVSATKDIPYRSVVISTDYEYSVQVFSIN